MKSEKTGLFIVLVFTLLCPMMISAAVIGDTVKTFDPQSVQTLSVSNISGEINIIPSDDDNLRISAVKESSDNTSDPGQVEILFENEAGNLLVTSDYKEKRSKISVNYKIEVPKGISVQVVKNISGNIAISSCCGNLDVSSTDGDIVIDNVAGTLSARAVNGDISFSGNNIIANVAAINGNITGELFAVSEDAVIRTVSGKIQLKVSSDVNADFCVEKLLGRIKVKDLDYEKISRNHFEVPMGDGTKTVFVRTVKGSVKLSAI